MVIFKNSAHFSTKIHSTNLIFGQNHLPILYDTFTCEPCCQRLINSQTKGSFGRLKIAQQFQLQIPSLFLC